MSVLYPQWQGGRGYKRGRCTSRTTRGWSPGMWPTSNRLVAEIYKYLKAHFFGWNSEGIDEERKRERGGCISFEVSMFFFFGVLPASLTLSTLCCERGGAALSGPGVPPTEPGDRVSSLPGPEYDRDDDGGRCSSIRRPTNPKRGKDGAKISKNKEKKNQDWLILNFLYFHIERNSSHSNIYL